LGYGVDVWLKTAPWGLIVGLALGFVAGAVNVVRAAWAYGASQPLGDPAPRSDEKED
jgi:ATP synthase protein I